MKYGETEVQKVEAIPTGCLTLDIALGIGGIPRGRIIEIYGPESSGKTTVALHMIAETQKQGGMAAFIDAEHALDPYYAQALGVQINDLYIAQPDSGEQALNITETLVRSNSIDLIVVDSGAALTPQAEIDGEIGDSSVGLQARLMTQAMRKLTAICNKSRCSIVFFKQRREKVAYRLQKSRHDLGRRGSYRQPHKGAYRQKQGRTSVQSCGIRHSFRQRNFTCRLRA